MKCKECVDAGLESILEVKQGWMSHAMCGLNYFDKEGREHIHDPNHPWRVLVCSNGHEFVETRKNTCWCGWPNAQEDTLGTSTP